MPETRKIILILFYLLHQTLAAENIYTPFDKMINSSIKTSARPCDDFYSYACGNYNEHTFFNISLRRRDLPVYVNLHYNTVIINLLETLGRRQYQMEESCQILTQKVRTYFDSCRKVSKRNLTRYLEEIKPGPDLNWPIFENKSTETSKWPHGKNFDVFSLLGKLDSIGFSKLIFRVMQRGDVEITEIEISPMVDFAETLLGARKQQILTQLSSIGVENPSQMLEDAIATDRTLQFLSAEPEQLNQSHSAIISFGDLLTRYPNLNFESYFMAYMGQQLPLNTSIRLHKPFSFQQLNYRIWVLFDKSELCNYIMIHYLIRFDATTKFSNMLCVDELRHVFSLALDLLYYHHNVEYQEKLVKPDVTEIFETVADMLGKHLQSHDLQLTVHQIESLRQKLAGIRLNIGSLPDNASCAKIAELYSSVSTLNENNYYKNHLLMLRFVNTKFYRIHLRMYKYRVSRLPEIIQSNAKQVIALSYAYLVPPIYDFHYNNLDKYTLLGFILARMLVGYSNIGSLNSHGYIGFSQPLQSALECLKTPAQNGHVPHIAEHVEDIVASEVVRKIVTLKFFNLQPIQSVSSWKKQFFLNVAQHYCNSYNDIDIFGEAKSDRLNRIAMNIEGFSQTFNCPESSKVKTSEKCKI